MKYFSRKIKINGTTFDSESEALRYRQLLALQSADYISQLHRQVTFTIIPKQTVLVPKQLKTKVKMVERVIESRAVYTCDFIYRERGRIVVEEVKSYATKLARDYPLRRKLIIMQMQRHNGKAGRMPWVFRETEISVSKHTIKKISFVDK